MKRAIAIVIANGASLTQEDVDLCRGKGFVIAVSDAYRLAPWADALYACDGIWWDHHIDKITGFDDRMWSPNPEAAKTYGLRHIPIRADERWSDNPAYIASGGNSGFQALNLAHHWGYREIIALGFDFKLGPRNKKHWFGRHPGAMDKNSPYEDWCVRFEKAMPLIEASETHIINCSRETALDCLERRTLEDIFAVGADEERDDARQA